MSCALLTNRVSCSRARCCLDIRRGRLYIFSYFPAVIFIALKSARVNVYMYLDVTQVIFRNSSCCTWFWTIRTIKYLSKSAYAAP